MLPPISQVVSRSRVMIEVTLIIQITRTKLTLQVSKTWLRWVCGINGFLGCGKGACFLRVKLPIKLSRPEIPSLSLSLSPKLCIRHYLNWVQWMLPTCFTRVYYFFTTDDEHESLSVSIEEEKNLPGVDRYIWQWECIERVKRLQHYSPTS